MTVLNNGPILQKTDSQACALEARGVSDELMLSLAVQEERVLVENGTFQQQNFCSGEGLATRQACLQCMLHLSEELGLEMKGWIEAVTLLDLHVLSDRGKNSGSDRCLPLACVAIVRLVKKVDDALFWTNEVDFSVYVSVLAQQLGKMNTYTTESSLSDEQMLQQEELRILQATDWRIRVPTIESWMSAYCARFSVLTRDVFMGSLVWIWQQGMALAQNLLRRYTIAADIPPRRIARGLVSMLFVAANLLPLSMFQPKQMSRQSWEELFVSSVPVVASVPSCELNEGMCRCITEVLEAATCTELAMLCEDCVWVAKLVQEAPCQEQREQRIDTKLASTQTFKQGKIHHSSI